MKDGWLDEVRAEQRAFLAIHKIKPKQYYRIVWDKTGHITEYQETPDGPTIIRKRKAGMIVDTVKKEKAPRRQRGASVPNKRAAQGSGRKEVKGGGGSGTKLHKGRGKGGNT